MNKSKWPQTAPLLTLLEINERVHLQTLPDHVRFSTITGRVLCHVISTKYPHRWFEFRISSMYTRPDINTTVDYIRIDMCMSDHSQTNDVNASIEVLSRTTINTKDINGNPSPGWLDRFEIAYKTYMEALDWPIEKILETWTYGTEGGKQ